MKSYETNEKEGQTIVNISIDLDTNFNLKFYHFKTKNDIYFTIKTDDYIAFKNELITLCNKYSLKIK